LGIKFLRSVCFFGVLLFFNLAGSGPVFAQTAPNRDALASYKGGKYEEAVSICLEEIKDNPANLDSFVVAGWAFLRLGRFSDARDAALSGRKVNFYDPRLVETLGESCYFLGLNGEAKKYFEEYVNLAPQGAEIELVYYYMGEIFIREGRFRHADIAFTSALHHRPNSALWWSRLGYARERSGETTGAIRSYERALGLDSTLADAKRGMERLRAAVSR
jgi:tetratricopeptide (TPR) repeat protein